MLGEACDHAKPDQSFEWHVNLQHIQNAVVREISL